MAALCGGMAYDRRRLPDFSVIPRTFASVLPSGAGGRGIEQMPTGVRAAARTSNQVPCDAINGPGYPNRTIGRGIGVVVARIVQGIGQWRRDTARNPTKEICSRPTTLRRGHRISTIRRPPAPFVGGDDLQEPLKPSTSPSPARAEATSKAVHTDRSRRLSTSLDGSLQSRRRSSGTLTKRASIGRSAFAGDLDVDAQIPGGECRQQCREGTDPETSRYEQPEISNRRPVECKPEHSPGS
jgi:hypothetical protein